MANLLTSRAEMSALVKRFHSYGNDSMAYSRDHFEKNKREECCELQGGRLNFFESGEPNYNTITAVVKVEKRRGTNILILRCGPGGRTVIFLEFDSKRITDEWQEALCRYTGQTHVPNPALRRVRSELPGVVSVGRRDKTTRSTFPDIVVEQVDSDSEVVVCSETPEGEAPLEHHQEASPIAHSETPKQAPLEAPPAPPLAHPEGPSAPPARPLAHPEGPSAPPAPPLAHPEGPSAPPARPLAHPEGPSAPPAPPLAHPEGPSAPPARPLAHPEGPSAPPAPPLAHPEGPSAPPARPLAHPEGPSAPPAPPLAHPEGPSAPPARPLAHPEGPSAPPAPPLAHPEGPSAPPARPLAHPEGPSAPPAPPLAHPEGPSAPPARPLAHPEGPSAPPAPPLAHPEGPSAPPARPLAPHSPPGSPSEERVPIFTSETSETDSCPDSLRSIDADLNPTLADLVKHKFTRSYLEQLKFMDFTGNDIVKEESPLCQLHVGDKIEMRNVRGPEMTARELIEHIRTSIVLTLARGVVCTARQEENELVINIKGSQTVRLDTVEVILRACTSPCFIPYAEMPERSNLAITEINNIPVVIGSQPNQIAESMTEALETSGGKLTLHLVPQSLLDAMAEEDDGTHE